MAKIFSFTSESVSRPHPDKICDFISDSILDEILSMDKNGKTAIETIAAKNRLIIAGEVTTTAKINYKKIAREKIKEFGYTKPFIIFLTNPLSKSISMNSHLKLQQE